MPNVQNIPLTAGAALKAGLVLLCTSVPVHAQTNLLFGNQGPFLQQADFVLADAAARSLLEPQPAPTGTAANWANAATGSSGTLTMGPAFQREGHDCRSIAWHELFKAGAERTVLLDTCLVSGAWKLM